MKKRPGFTLIELVIVLAIIAMLMILIIPNVSAQKDRANKRTDEAFVTTLQTQVDLADNDKYGLTELQQEGFITQKQLDRAKANHLEVKNGKVYQDGVQID